MSAIALVGRSSSHFTRVARIFAIELGIAHDFRVVPDLTSLDAAAYAGNPALKIPVLVDERGPLFGTENICRELVRRSGSRAIVMPGQIAERAVANVEELTMHLMSANVSLVFAKLAGDGPPPAKLARSVENTLRHLDEHLDAALAALPRERALSFVEVALFAVVTHLPFRVGLDVSPFARLGEFCRRFGERASAQATTYRFDAA